MENAPGSGKGLVWMAVILTVGFIVGAGLIAHGYERSKNASLETLSLYGNASKTVDADKAKWSLQLSHTAPSMKAASAGLEADGKALRELVKNAGITDANFSFHPAVVKESSNYNYEARESSPYGYANQTVVIESSQAEKLGSVAESASRAFSNKESELLSNGIEFFYTKLDDLQKELAKQAMDDARSQASVLVGGKLGALQSVSPPQFQVTPEQSSTNNYYYGYQDTSSIKKKISASINVTYRLK